NPSKVVADAVDKYDITEVNGLRLASTTTSDDAKSEVVLKLSYGSNDHTSGTFAYGNTQKVRDEEFTHSAALEFVNEIKGDTKVSYVKVKDFDKTVAELIDVSEKIYQADYKDPPAGIDPSKKIAEQVAAMKKNYEPLVDKVGDKWVKIE